LQQNGHRTEAAATEKYSYANVAKAFLADLLQSQIKQGKDQIPPHSPITNRFYRKLAG
jgi:hypothetical protein